MKLLRVKASNFKNCSDDFTIDFVARSKKTAEDKEYELCKIDDELYTYNTMAFIGKNASGKTTAIELLDCCYSIMGNFCLENKHYSYNNINLEIIFYHNKCIYKYTTTLSSDTTLSNKATFKNEKIYQKKYCKSYISTIYEDDGFEEISDLGELPEDTSKLFFILKKKNTSAVYFNCDGEGLATYNQLFKLMKTYTISPKVLLSVLKIFDSNIQDFSQIDEHQYRLVYNTKEQILSENELIYTLSSGTTKGMLLYILVVASLKNGFDLLVDEIENHFHKTLVENVISLYKDKSVNKSHATISFTTHYCEVLDLFNRQDNIWITKCDKKVYIENMYSKYNVRSGILKSKQFYNDAFETSVNYEDLMSLKKSSGEMSRGK